MIAADHALRDTATAHSDAVLALVDVLRASRAGQWEPPTGSRVLTHEGIPDPTGEAATAATGLALRARVAEALARMEAATADFNRLASDLEELLLIHSDPAARHDAFVAATADLDAAFTSHIDPTRDDRP